MPAAPAPRNRTITLDDDERIQLLGRCLTLHAPTGVGDVMNRTVLQDMTEAVSYLPNSWVDLLFLDPPYNLDKSFKGSSFSGRSLPAYAEWFEGWFVKLLPLLTPNATIYVCGDWRSSAALHMVLDRHVFVRNRITWEREKGRGANSNWKNSSEDIWFCTVSNTYTFNVDAVKLKRRVIAPYTDQSGKPKDWDRTDAGNFRLTHPSNLWTDITVPFWSMPENTEHPTQKPEKLLAKLILASTNAGDVVFDPFVGSGTTSVVAKKLGRHYIGIEQEPEYCCLAEKRLQMAESDPSIQGYSDRVFWERNTLSLQSKAGPAAGSTQSIPLL